METRARLKHVSTLRLKPNATSALEPKMVHTDPKPRYSEEIESGVLFFVALGNAHGKRYGTQNGNKSTKSRTSPRPQVLRHIKKGIEQKEKKEEREVGV